MMNSETVAQKILKISIAVSIGFLTIQLIVAFLTRSQMLLADGISASIGTIATCFTLGILKFIAKRDDKRYPFGKETLEPFIGIINYIILSVIIVIIIIDNVQMVRAGGNDSVYVTAVILFGIFAVIFNIGGYKYLKSLAKDHLTPTIEVVLVGWKFSAIVAVGIVLGFSFSWALDMTGFSDFTPYIDPILAIVFMSIFAWTPIIEIRNCMRELMQARPSSEVITTVTGEIEKIDQDYDFSDKFLRLGKVGSKIMIEIDYVIEKNSKLDCISEQDQLRSRLSQGLVELPYKKWLNINFTSDVKWADHIAK